MRQSLQKIKPALSEQQGTPRSGGTIRRWLKKPAIRPSSNVKRWPPKPHPDREPQFQYLIKPSKACLRAGWPCIRGDSKKRDRCGLFYNRATPWCQTAPAVNPPDFPRDATGPAGPDGIDDLAHNLGYVAVGNSADTPECAVDAIEIRVLACS